MDIQDSKELKVDSVGRAGDQEPLCASPVDEQVAMDNLPFFVGKYRILGYIRIIQYTG